MGSSTPLPAVAAQFGLLPKIQSLQRLCCTRQRCLVDEARVAGHDSLDQPDANPLNAGSGDWVRSRRAFTGWGGRVSSAPPVATWHQSLWSDSRSGDPISFSAAG